MLVSSALEPDAGHCGMEASWRSLSAGGCLRGPTSGSCSQADVLMVYAASEGEDAASGHRGSWAWGASYNAASPTLHLPWQ